MKFEVVAPFVDKDAEPVTKVWSRRIPPGGSMRKRKKQRNLRLLVQKYLEARGWTVGVVERQTGPVKRDLFGVADLLAFIPGTFDGEVMLVQVTSIEHHADHYRKATAWLKNSGWLSNSTSFLLAEVDEDGHVRELYPNGLVSSKT